MGRAALNLRLSTSKAIRLGRFVPILIGDTKKMSTKLTLAAVAAGLVAAAALPLQTNPVQAGSMAGMTCSDAAKMKYPDDRKMRRDWKKACKDAWKVSQGK